MDWQMHSCRHVRDWHKLNISFVVAHKTSHSHIHAAVQCASFKCSNTIVESSEDAFCLDEDSLRFLLLLLISLFSFCVMALRMLGLTAMIGPTRNISHVCAVVAY